MSVVCHEGLAAHQAALSWAEKHFPFDEASEISRKPWGTTYRLSNATGHAFLKILPDALKHAARTTPRIGQRFPGRVPEAIAGDEERGFLLLKDHQGEDLSSRPSFDLRLGMLRTYAEIQASAAGDPMLLKGHPRLELDQVVARLLEFLRPNSSLADLKHGVVAADYFLGAQEARRYCELVARRSDLLAAHIAMAKDLPDTINHLDLRPSNAAVKPDGTCVIYDWEEALVGPAGLSLHNVFHGSRLPTVLLLQERDYYNPDENRQAIRLLADYVDILTAAGYANRQALQACLGGSATAGLIHFITSFASYPTENDKYRGTLADNIRTALSELLDVCDFLTVHTNSRALFEFVADYRHGGRVHRAQELLAHHLHREPLDPIAFHEQGRNYLHEGRCRAAVESFQSALQVTPEKATLHADIAQAYSAGGDFASALYHARRSLHLAPGDARTQELLTHVTALHQSRELASRPGTVPMVDFADGERAAHRMAAGKLELCIELFQKYGVLQLNNVIDRELLQDCHVAFLQKYQRYLTEQRHSDALTIGNKRYQVTIDLTKPFDDAAIFANPLIVPVLKALLGDDCMLGAYTSSMSLPGAEDQPAHKDHKALFPEDEELKSLPSFAISLMIPLINVDERVGTTRVRKGSHRLTSRESEDLPTQSPLVDVGSCYLMDYRLTHYGQANQSNLPRPIVNILYQRSWFKDLTNFHKQPPVRISRQRFETLAKSQQELLRWTQYPSPLAE